MWALFLLDALGLLFVYVHLLGRDGFISLVEKLPGAFSLVEAAKLIPIGRESFHFKPTATTINRSLLHTFYSS